MRGQDWIDAEKFFDALKPVPPAVSAEPVAWLQIGLPQMHDGDIIARTRKPDQFDPSWWRFEPLYRAPPSADAALKLAKEALELAWSDQYVNGVAARNKSILAIAAIDAAMQKGGA